MERPGFRGLALVVGLTICAVEGAGAARGRSGALENAPSVRSIAAVGSARSIGSPTDGRLEGGIPLAPSRELRLKNPQGARWGLPALVALLERSADRLAQRFHGSVVVVGDLSRRRGGDIAGHKSHESGRDADVGFFFLGAKGEQIPSAQFHVVDADGIAVDDRSLRFDDARNWALVEAWVTDPRARVEHIFVADALRARLLKAARERGTYRPVLNRAAIALKQPTTGQAHDDHFHVRIACPRRSAGPQGECVLDPHSSRVAAHVPAHRANRFAAYVPSPRRSGAPLRALVKPRKERETTRR